MKKIHGIMPPMVTVWNKDETYDEKGTLNHLEFLIKNGIHAVSFCGSTGENISMSPDENKLIIKSLVDGVNGRIPAYAGTGFYSTKTTIEVSQYAEKVGADGVLIILPYYLQPYKEAVMEHFRTIKRNIGIPIMLYNNPWFAGYQLTPYEIATLASEKVITSVKLAHGDPASVHEIKYLAGDNISVFYGHDYAGLEGLLAGADGWFSGILNIVPQISRQLYDAITIDKDIDKAKMIWNRLMPLINFSTYEKINGAPHWLEVGKEALNIIGCNVGYPRKPLGSLSKDMHIKLEKVLDEVFK